jgi:hypothetical protein
VSYVAQAAEAMNYQPIEDYGLIVDLATTALVSLHDSIDFMCFPQFASPTLYAALLDHAQGGHRCIEVGHCFGA